MPYLYCETHGREREAEIAGQQEDYRQADEAVLVVTGTLISGPWQCDGCNAQLRKGDIAYLTSAFPGHFSHNLYDYNFDHERNYFVMTQSDNATAYGAAWLNDSISKMWNVGRREARQRKEPLCALDLRPPKPAE